MPAIMTINADGLAAGEPGVARDDGLPNGDTVFLASTAHERTAEFALLWVGQHPTPDTSSVETLQLVSESEGSIEYAFEPTAGVFGSWRIELVTDRGTPVEDRQVRIFAIKTAPNHIRIPAANEVSDPEANLRRRGPTYLARSEFNAGDGVEGSPQEGGSFVSHWRPIADLIHRFNAGGGAAVRTVTADATLDFADTYVRCTNDSDILLTVPTGSVPLGHQILISRLNGGGVSVTNAVGVTVTCHPGRSPDLDSAGLAHLVNRGENLWDLFGLLVEAS